jgi:hypothetical protein
VFLISITSCENACLKKTTFNKKNERIIEYLNSDGLHCKPTLTYNSDSFLISKKSFVNGSLELKEEFYLAGGIKTRTRYLDSIKVYEEGLFSDGSLEYKKNIKDSILDGEFESFYSNGKLNEKGKVFDDSIDYFFKFNVDGELIEDIRSVYFALDLTKDGVLVSSRLNTLSFMRKIDSVLSYYVLLDSDGEQVFNKSVKSNKILSSQCILPMSSNNFNEIMINYFVYYENSLEPVIYSSGILNWNTSKR